MKTRVWQITIRFEGELLNARIEAMYQYDAYIEVQKKYPGCIIKKVAETKN